MRSAAVWMVLVAAVAGCKEKSAKSTKESTTGRSNAGKTKHPNAAAALPDACNSGGPTVVHVRTRDGVELEGDLYSAGKKGGAAAILLHMIPPNNDRKNFPRALIDRLVEAEITVLNIDRRGAGGSKGKPIDAYRGPKGKLDAQAAYELIAAHPCKLDRRRIVWIGASNGTTTALDFTVAAKTHPKYEWPRAMVLLSGGHYTEKQHKLDDHRDLLETIPMLFLYPRSERSWNEALEQERAPIWTFEEIEGRDHGTKLFDRRPEVVDTVVGFAVRTVKT